MVLLDILPTHLRFITLFYLSLSTYHPGLAEIPAPDWDTGSDIINQIKFSHFLSKAVKHLKKLGTILHRAIMNPLSQVLIPHL